MTPSPIPAALSPDEWGQVVVSAGHAVVALNFGGECQHEIGREHHRIAALCLYQQPFGFTQEHRTTR